MKKTEVDADVTIVSLDQVQRINLVMLIGALEANVGEMRALWALQDRLDLTPEEKYEIGFASRIVQGTEVYSWDITKTLSTRTYELTDGDISRISKALAAYPRHRAGSVRTWLEPLLTQAPALLGSNGTK